MVRMASCRLAGQRVVAHGAALGRAQRPDVVLGGGGELVALLDALEPGAEQHGVGQVGVGRRVDAAVFDPRGLALAGLVQRDADQGGAVVVAPAEVAGGFAAAPEPLVGVHELVGDGGELRGVLEDAGDELPRRLGELELGTGLVEGVRVALEKREVRVHAGARVGRERLRHEGGVGALLQRDLFDHGAERHDVVGGLQRVRVAQVDFVLAGARLVVAELHGDADRFEHGDGGAAEVLGDAARNVVEVAALVHGHRGAVRARVLGLQQVELDLGVGVAGEAHVRGLGQVALEDVARIRGGGFAVGGQDVAEHPGRRLRLAAPGQDLEGGGIRLGQHVGFEDAGEAFDRGAVKAQAFLEGPLNLGRGKRHGLQ